MTLQQIAHIETEDQKGHSHKTEDCWKYTSGFIVDKEKVEREIDGKTYVLSSLFREREKRIDLYLRLECKTNPLNKHYQKITFEGNGLPAKQRAAKFYKAVEKIFLEI